MGVILAIIIVVLLFGGGGYYGYRRYGGPGLGGVIAVVSVMFLVLWLAGGLHLNRGADLGSAKSPVFVILGAH
jgi:hypothetical protein